MTVFSSRFDISRLSVSRLHSSRFTDRILGPLPPPPPPNIAPVAVADSVETDQDTALTLSAATLLGNDSDADGGTLTILSVTAGTGGTPVLNPNGSVTFTPTLGFSGTASFDYRVTDGQGGTDTASVTVTVTAAPAPNVAPTAGDDTAETDEDTALTLSAATLLGNDSDTDGGTLEILSVTAGTGGTPVLNPNGSVTFTPTPGFTGSADFSYTLSDNQGGTDTASVTVTVTAAPVPNVAPTAGDDTAETDEDTALTLSAATLLGNDSDTDGGTLEILSVTAGTGGTPVLNPNGSVTFTPTPGFTGSADFSYTLSDNQGGTDTATVTVTVVPTGPTSRASITAVQADGWRATDSAPITFDPVAAPEYVIAGSQGHDAAGSNTIVSRSLPIMARVRQPYPNQASLSANDVALADFVYASDTVTGLTNTSTRPYPKPICMWLDHDCQRVTTQSYTARLAVAHWHAQQGRPVAAIVFSASDGTNTVTQTITTMTPVSYAASGLTIPCFEATLDLSSLAADTLITIDAEIRPWIGPAWTASQDFATYPSINFCEMKVFNAVADTPIYAYCDPTGDNGTGVASTNATTAEASPFASVAAAAAAIRALDGSDASRGVIRLNAGTYTHASFSGVAVGATPLIIEASNPANRDTTIYSDGAANVSNGCPDLLKFKDLTLQKDAGNAIFIDNGANLTNSIDHMVALDNVRVTGSGVYGAWFYRTGRTWAIDTDIGDVGLLRPFSSVNKMVQMIGSVGSNGNAIYNIAASRMTGSTNNVATPGSARETPDGQFIGHSVLSDDSTSSPVLTADLAIGTGGYAVVGSVIEDRDGGSAAAVKIGGDGNTVDMQNVVLHGNTIIGQRLNLLYNDAAPYAVKSGQLRFNAIKLTNTKSDTFEKQTTAVNNWAVTHKVGWRLNAYLEGDNQGNDSFGAGHWLGELAALGDVTGSQTTPINADWTDDQSADGGATGGGDYTPGANTALLSYGDADLLPYAQDQTGAVLTATSRIGAIG